MSKRWRHTIGRGCSNVPDHKPEHWQKRDNSLNLASQGQGLEMVLGELERAKVVIGKGIMEDDILLCTQYLFDHEYSKTSS